MIRLLTVDDKYNLDRWICYIRFFTQFYIMNKFLKILLILNIRSIFETVLNVYPLILLIFVESKK